jgi:hypothetical protein
MALTQVQGQMLTGSSNTTTTIQSNGTTAITIDSSQRVGIGTASPASGLEVKGTGSFPRLTLSDTSLAASATIACNDGDLILTADSGGAVASSAMSFYVDATEAMRIASSGNLLVGTTSGFGRVTSQYLGGDAFVGIVSSLGSGLAISSNGISNTMTAAYFSTNFGGVGSITCSSSTAYNTSSDYRLKDNIAPMTGALSKVALLKPCTYTWKADGSSGEGFIAHELAEVCPDAVTGEKDAVNEDGSIKAQGIDTSFLVATLTAAIQEQQAIITDLKARIETLEAK